MLSVERLTVHSLRQNDLLALKLGCDFTDREDCPIAIPTDDDDALRDLLSMQGRVDHAGLLEHGPQ